MDDTATSAPCFRLPRAYDVARLEADLAALEGLDWPPERPFIMDTPFTARTQTYHDGRWRGLGLRTQGGAWTSTDPGGPGLRPFQDSELLERTPYFREVLDGLACEKRSVRLLSLPGGAEVKEHTDPYHGFHFGQLRLHVPIRTDPGVLMLFGGQEYRWGAGELWYADFGKPHAVVNASGVERVHLVIDVLVSDGLLELFPGAFVAERERAGVLRHQPAVRLDEHELASYVCDFTMPAALLQGVLETDDGSVPGELRGAVRVEDGRLVMSIEGAPVFALVPIGGHRFTLCGWTAERHVAFELDGGGVRAVTLALRSGHLQSTVTMPARR